MSKRIIGAGVAVLMIMGVFTGLMGQAPVDGGTWAPGGVMVAGARDGASPVLLDAGRVLVLGGRNADGAIASAEIYANGEWSQAPGVMEVWGHTATPLLDGRVLIAGGETASGLSALLDIFDPADQSLTPAGALWSVRRGHAATRLADGRVLIAGGFDGQQVVTSAEIFDPRDGSVYSAPFSLSVARAGLTATTLLDGRVLLAGGNDGENDLALVEIVDVSTGVVSLRAMGTARRDHSAVLLPNNNSVLLTGGVSPDGVLRSAELYIPWLDQFRATGSMVQPRHLGTLAALSAESYGSAAALDGLVIAAGGAEVPASELFRFAMVKADKDDYLPGEKVYISGSGWQPNEEIALTLREVPSEHSARAFMVTADGSGRLDNVFLFDVEDHHLGVRFYLTARGAVSQAQTTFTDGTIILNPTLGVVGTSVGVSGGSWGSSASVKVRWGGSSGEVVAECTAHANGNLGAGGNTCSFPVPATAAPGDHTVYASSGPANTGVATFTVLGPPVRLAITVNGGLPPTSGTNFSVLLRSVDALGKDSPVSTTTEVTLSLKTGTGTLAGTLTGTISSGSSTGTISGVNYNKAEQGVVITARRTSTNDWDGNSAEFTVNNPSPTLTGISTGSGARGETLSVGFTGTNFLSGVSSVNVGAGITVNSATVNSATSLTASITIDANTTTGTRSFSVTNPGPGGGTSTTQAFTVGLRGATTTVSCFPNPVGTNQTTTCTATVTDTSSGLKITPTGTVGSWTSDRNGTFAPTSCILSGTGDSASCAVSYTPTQGNTHNVEAIYSGDSNHSTSKNSPKLALVTNSLPATTLAVEPASGTVGGTVTLSATLRNASTNAVISGKTVSFRLNGTSVGTAPTNGSGVASLSGVSLAGIPEGTYPNALAATFNGDGSFNGSTGFNTLAVQSAVSNQTISVTTPAPAGAAHAGTFTVAAAASSGLPVSITTSGVCSGSGSGSATITMTSGTGPCTVQFNQAGNSSFNAAPEVTSVTTAQTATQAITFDVLAGKTFGDAPFGVSAAASSGLPVSFSIVSGPATVSGDTVTLTGAGSVTVRAAQAGNGDYAAAADVDRSFAVAKAGQTITFDVLAGKTYGDAPFGVSAAASSGLPVSFSIVAGPATVSGDMVTITGAGSVTVRAAQGGNGDHEAAADVDRTFAIAKAAAVVAVNGTTVTYDGSAHGASGSATGVNGEDLASLLNLGDGFTNAPGGTASWSFAGNTNYAAQSGTAAIVINKAAANVTVTGYEGIYDGSAHGASGSATGVTGEDLASLLNLGDGFTNAPGGTASWSFAGNTNYAAQSGTAAIVINKATAVVAVNGTTVTYDGNAHGATGTATGVNNETLAGLDLGASFTSVPGGTANWVFTDVTGNYNGATGSVAITINRRPVTGTFTVGSKIYDGTNAATIDAGSLDLANVVDDDGRDDVNLVAGSATFASRNAGTHAVSGSGFSLAGDDALNYSLTSVSAPDATITTRALAVTATGGTKVYDGNTSATVMLADDRIDGDVLNVGSTAEFVNKNVGNGKTINVTGISLTGTDGLNYTPNASTTTTANITPRALVVSATGVDKIYDGTTAATVRLSDNRVVGDVLTTGYASATFADKKAGTWTVTVSGISVTGTDVTNYTYNPSTTTTATILKKGVTVKADAKVKVFGAADPTLTYQLTDGGLVSGEQFTGTLARVAGEAVGSYEIQKGGLEAGDNYALTYLPNHLTIGAWSVRGFHAPIGMTNSFMLAPGGTAPLANSNTVWQVAKGGSTIPLKFNVFADGIEKKSPGDVKDFMAVPLAACTTGGVNDTIDELTSLSIGTGLQYDGEQFHQNWKTPTVSKDSCYRVVVTMKDNSTIHTFVKLRK